LFTKYTENIDVANIYGY